MNRSASNELVIWVNGLRVGRWRAPSQGAMDFSYDSEWVNSQQARPLSLSLPLALDRVPLKGAAVNAYFENLLPDSELIRRRLQERFQTPSRNAFDLLAAIGRDCVGAIQLLDPNEHPDKIKTIEAEPLDTEAVARAIAHAISSDEDSLGIDELRISLAGAQEKTAFLRHKDQWCLPLGATPTTHIFKLPLGLVGNKRADMTTSVENEWLCARILKAYGLPVAACTIERFENFKVLVVERFDRVLHSSGKYWLRLMQEDMCQATATPSDSKYEAEGGPGLRELGGILRGSVHRQQDLLTLFKTQLLFWMMAATDGHAKNFSIRMLSGGRYHLTPLYDVLSVWPIIGNGGSHIAFDKVKLAMALRSKRPHYRIKDIQRRHFDGLAKQFGLGENADSIVDEIIAATPKVIEQVQRDLPNKFPQRVLEPILKGIDRSAAKLAQMK